MMTPARDPPKKEVPQVPIGLLIIAVACLLIETYTSYGYLLLLTGFFVVYDVYYYPPDPQDWRNHE